MENTYFFMRAKRTNGTIEKGVEVKTSLEAALQSYHAYLGAYAYQHDVNTDYVACYVVSTTGERMTWEVWQKVVEPEPEVEPEGE